jgi:pyocin large subunit-like protein
VLHYAKHASEFTLADAVAYETSASNFLTKPAVPSMMECVTLTGRRVGDTVRYDTATMEFGVLSATGYIRTYFKPIPCSAAVGLPPGGSHGYPNNVDYFSARCRS